MYFEMAIKSLNKHKDKHSSVHIYVQDKQITSKDNTKLTKAKLVLFSVLFPQ